MPFTNDDWNMLKRKYPMESNYDTLLDTWRF